MSEVLKEYHSAKAREKMSRASKEYHNRPEIRENQSNMMKELWSNPEYKERVSKSIKKAQNRPELIKRNSKKRKASKAKRNLEIIELKKQGLTVRELMNKYSLTSKQSIYLILKKDNNELKELMRWNEENGTENS